MTERLRDDQVYALERELRILREKEERLREQIVNVQQALYQERMARLGAIS